MGIDYKIKCSQCNKVRDAYSAQAWGKDATVSDAITVLKFISKHTNECYGSTFYLDGDPDCEYDLDSYDDVLPDLE